MKVGYVKLDNNGFAKVNTPLKTTELYDVLFNNPGLTNLDPNHEKHCVGTIYFHTNDKTGNINNPLSDGIICCDIDAISKDDCVKIVESFDKIALAFPCIVSAWYSYSYNDSNKNYGGLHIVVKTDKDKLVLDSDERLDRREYFSFKEVSRLYTAALAYIINKVCKIDVRPYKNEHGKGVGIDAHLTNISHQCFLNFSKVVKWNDSIFDVHISDDDADKLTEWFDEDYHPNKQRWFAVKDDYKIESITVKRFNVETYNGDSINLGHNNRVTVENFLASENWDKKSIVDFMMKICGPEDYAGGADVLQKAISQTTSTAISKYSSNGYLKIEDWIVEKACSILKKIGVDIDVDIKKIYAPLEYNFESIFEEVWNEHKDDPYYNVYTNPRNLLKINLKNNEYLKDYKDDIMNVIYQYELTYLIADCMTGKTTLALDVIRENGLFDNDDNFIIHVSGDAVDICVPYNSVADNKAKESRKDIKRVVTADISKFSLEKRNVFIWNTIMPLYEEYFHSGVVKRAVLFFDESQKIVTDDYRWETIFEMFKALPHMYKHFVFMTGTPAGEFEYLKEFFKDYAIIKVDKETDYNRECKLLKYNKFGFGDRIALIEECIANGRLPLIYSNTQNAEWKEAIKRINRDRISRELKPYRVLDYSRPNALELKGVNKTSSIKEYDIVIATKYCSVGIDFMKDDKRMRCSIIDYASEHDCTFHDIWQFTLRNRNQDTITKIILRDGEEYYNKLYNYWWYKDLFEDMAKLHTHKITEDDFSEMYDDEDDVSVKNFNFINDVFLARKFGRLVNDKNRYFSDPRNVKLLSVYYLYVKVFSNVRVIKNMLEKRGVDVCEIDMTHRELHNDNTTNKEIYRFFVDNFDEISNIQASKGQHDPKSYLIDINCEEKEYIKENKIWSRNINYMNWLIKEFAGNREWYKILCEREYMSKDIFNEFYRMRAISKRITTREINKIKKYKDYMKDYGIEEIIADLVYKQYGKELDIKKEDVRTAILLRDIINDYKKILDFAVDNIELIEEIKTAEKDSWISAVHKMDIAMRQKEQQKTNKKISNSMKRQITVIWDDGTEEIFESRDALAVKLGTSKSMLSQVISGKKKWSGRQFCVKNV